MAAINIGEKIRYYRNAAGLTQEKLAHGICVPSLISKFERGTALPDAETLRRLSARLEIEEAAFSESDVGELTERLKAWYELIMNRQIEHAKTEQPALEAAVGRSLEPDLEILYRIFKAKLLLSDMQVEEADSVLTELSDRRSLFTWEHNYYFHYVYGVTKSYQGDQKKGLESFLQTVAIGEKNGISDSRIYFAVSNIYYRLNCYPHTIMYGHIALEKAIGEKNYSFIADINMILALAYMGIGENKRALNLLKTCLYLQQDKRATNTLFSIHHNLGCVYLELKQYDMAHQAFETAFSCIDVNSKKYSLNCIYMAKLLFKQNNSASASEWINMGIAVARKEKYNKLLYELEALRHIWAIPNLASVNYIEKIALPYMLSCREYILVIEYCSFLVNYYQCSNQYKKALEYSILSNKCNEKIMKGVI